MNIIRIETATSTNTYLKELSAKKKLEEGTVAIARKQTAGKGQRGSSWESEAGKNILCSLILYPDFLPINENFLLSKIIAISVKETLELYADNFSIKWPNDIYWKDQKISGILIENELIGNQYAQAIIGIGININQDSFSVDLPNPISLKQIINQESDLDEFLDKLLSKIAFWYKQLKEDEVEKIENHYFQSLYRNSGFFPFSDKENTFYAQIDSVGKDGYLHLITDKQEKKEYGFKEVCFLA